MQPRQDVPLRRDWVVKSNDLINAKYDWTVLQQRMILLMIAQLDLDADDFGNQTVHIGELLDQGHVTGNAYYERAAEAAHVLLNQKIYVMAESGRWRGYNLLSYVEPAPGYIIARFNQDMRPFLLQLKRRFTRYMLEHVMRFQSPYSIRIYELAQQYADVGHRTIELDALRTMLAVEDKYPRFYDFRRRVLEQARREIRKFTDLDVTYDIIRDGRTPTAVKLYIRRKDEHESREQTPARRTGRKGDAARDPAQQALELPALERPADPVVPRPRPKSDPERAAFQAWLAERSGEEQADLERRATERLDPFVRQIMGKNPGGVAAQASLRAEMMTLWREAMAEG